MIAGVRDRIRQRDEALETARRFAEELADRFDDLSAVVFGSYARGDFHVGSDIDLLVLSDALPEDPMERQRILYELTPGGIDIFAYRRDEHARMLEKPPHRVLGGRRGRARVASVAVVATIPRCVVGCSRPC